MKNWILLSILSLLGTSVFAQFGNVNPKYWDGAADKTTIILLTDSEEVNEILVQKLEKFWTLNPYELVEISELAQYTGKPEYLFLTPGTYTFTRTSPYMEYTVLKFNLTDGLNVSRRGEINYDKVNFLGSGQFDLVESDNPELMLEAEVQKCIQFLMNHAEIALSGKTPKKMDIKDYLAMITKERHDEARKSTLLITEDQLSEKAGSLSEVKGIYQHPIEVTEQDEIYQHVIDQSEGYAYVMFYRFANLTYKILVDTETGRLLYGKVATGFIQHQLGPKDFKKMN